MTIKDKLKSYNFWITLVSAIILLLQVFGEKFNFKIDSTFIIDVTTALCSIFVILGIISVPKSKTTKTDIRFVEPNYDELSSKISTNLAEKFSFIESKTDNNLEIDEIKSDEKTPEDDQKVDEKVDLDLTNNNQQTTEEMLFLDENSNTLSD